MDLNIKIIEGVQQFPALHDNCGDLDERNHAWVQLAEKLDMHVQVLQIRWHALLQLYHRDNNFKYSNKMQFIYRNEEPQGKADNWPEFVITDEYLKGYNNEDQEQFIYLDTEEDNNSQSLRLSKENECNYSKEVEDKYLSNREDENSVAEKENEEVNRISRESQPQDKAIKINSPLKSKEPDISNNTALTEKEVALVDLNKNDNNTSPEKSNEKPSEKPSPLIGERCEDVIFGELVSAMLKRMDENKKKSIKKEIMNILFS